MCTKRYLFPLQLDDPCVWTLFHIGLDPRTALFRALYPYCLRMYTKNVYAILMSEGFREELGGLPSCNSGRVVFGCW